MKFKLLFYTTLITTLFSTLYFGLFRSIEKEHPQKCYEQFIAGNYSLAEEALKKSEDVYLFPLALYQGLIASGRLHFVESEYFLQQVLKNPPGKNQKEVLIESYLAQITNAYLRQQDHLISPLLDTAKQFSPGNSLILFFEGLRSYLDERYGEALSFWTTLPNNFLNSKGEHSWVIYLVEKFFPMTFRHLHVAHCFTEEGDIATGREILEKQQHNLDDQNSEYYHLATLFLGLTYLKEAAEFPPAQRDSFYNLAQFYFSQAEKVKPFYREKDRVANHIQEEIYKLISNLSDEESLRWSFGFIRILHDWKAYTQLAAISDYAVKNCMQLQDEATMNFYREVRKEFGAALFYDLLSQKLKDSIIAQLQQGKSELYFPLWKVGEQLFLHPKTVAREIAQFTRGQMIEAIYSDDERLGRFREYLQFWKTFDHEKEEYVELSSELFQQALYCWNRETEELKGAHLFRFALQLSPDKEEMEKALQSRLNMLYKEAEGSNMIARMSLLHDALVSFGLGVEQNLIDRCKLANHLADAEYLYIARNYASCKTHAEWVLKHEPTNQNALRLVGLSSFQLGHYKDALHILAALPQPDLAVQKAIAFSQVYAKQEEFEHIAQIDQIDSFDEDDE